ncbi:group I truncated hemoglobin [Sideroxydans lithotrophicus]|uniref:Globin n=1 Tax=Sideroxydans lithotrophicus (strain ES-1) TaxID=580332 RepID=D5CPR0_SIDLE|nr:group 1 truncated hemoglobin [Sideroxydans lithotrophicus]ADE13055.1 globin [Sideroxydans lithotrophicus ES-1]
MSQTLFETMGGLPVLQRVHKIFYDKVYAHAWLKQFFAGHDQKAIEDRQTSFMAEKMGGPAAYTGKDIKMVHEAMYITPELFDLRNDLLEQSLQEAGLDEALRVRWLRIDNAFRKQIVKDSVESMYDNDWKYKKPIIIPKPAESERETPADR